MSSGELVRHRLGPVSALPVGEGRTFAVGTEQVAVYRLRDGALRAVSAVCPHSGGPLADGTVDAEKVVCPLHNFSFAFEDGRCLNGDFALTVFAVSEEDGDVVVEL
ncbi:Rieske (2Fe-2S) protein [Pseudonocardia sp. RS010]|uniref:Rieske (2Fe-2S) protein n=1 Tax=Pseudonocardia sp. RS010 TaxID=3385979 RepID=UPI0039A36951